MNKKILSYVASAVVALGAVFGLGVSVSDGIKIAFDKDAAKAYCEKLIEADKVAQ